MVVIRFQVEAPATTTTTTTIDDNPRHVVMPRSGSERCESTFVKVLKYLSDTHAVQTLALGYLLSKVLE